MQESDAPVSPHRAPTPPLSNQTIQEILAPYPNFLKIAHANTQSLLAHIDEFRSIFVNSSFDIILISESWLKPSVNDRSVEVHGYKLYRNDRLHKGGGELLSL